MQYEIKIGIDPAGIGNNGIVIYSNETNNIIFRETFQAKTILECKNIYKEKLKYFKKFLNNKKVLVSVENFYLNPKQLLTNPLATPKIIGALMVLVKDIMNWDYQENHPKNKDKMKNLGFKFSTISGTRCV
ncbi:hypothetical protein [Spiroplasma ixodetis]|uniref:Holliday junction resolvase RuvC n=1 Tax=Spiroplasma ixodetis TaxID=2141 RepID=A0ABM8JS06_9MOLU